MPAGASGPRFHAALPRPDGRGPARAARLCGCVGADLRPGVCSREAPAPQEGRISVGATPRLHQRSGVRRLRRLRCAVQLHLVAAPAHRLRAQAPGRPVVLQCRLFLHQGFLPELRHGRRCDATENQTRGGQRLQKRRAIGRAGPAIAGSRVQHPDHGHRRDRCHHDQRVDRNGGASGGQGYLGAGHDRHVAEERLGDVPCAYCARGIRTPCQLSRY